jgi:hypothetical protein
MEPFAILVVLVLFTWAVGLNEWFSLAFRHFSQRSANSSSQSSAAPYRSRRLRASSRRQAPHNLVNTSKTEYLRLYTVYSPPHHQDGLIEKTKAEAERSREHYGGKTTE